MAQGSEINATTQGAAAADAGRIFSAALPTEGKRRTISDFDPATDKLDLGDNSVHAFIVVDTAEGVAFMDPWSGREVLIAGVSLGQLTVDSFTPVQNDHLRQDLSGALAWEHGIVQAPHTVYARSHEVGQIDRVAFDPATDVVDFRYYGSREQIYMVDGAEGVVIGNYTTGQALILRDVKVADLSAENFLFHAAQVREDRVWQQLGFAQVPDSQVIGRDDIPTVGTDAWPTAAGPGAPPSGAVGTSSVIDWNYGAHAVLDFDPAVDTLDFMYFRPSEFSVAEVDGSVVISIVGQQQTYTLAGVGLDDLSYGNIKAVEDTTFQTWRALIDGAAAEGGQLPDLQLAAAAVVEGDAGTRLLRFEVTLSAPAEGAVSVDYATRNGSAVANADFVPALGTLTFAPGEVAKTIDVVVHGDTVYEGDESLDLVLSSPSGARLVGGTATGTIRDDDPAPQGDPEISIADATVAEGSTGAPHMMFEVSLSAPSDHAVSVRYATRDGTALAGSDYEAQAGTLTFAPGQTSAMVHVPLIGDATVEADERFTVVLSRPSGATLADRFATGIIVNDDAAPAPGGGAVAFAVTDDWKAGFVGEMTLTADAALDGWTVAFDAPFDITNIWNAEVVSHVGDHYVVRNAGWNGVVGADGTVSFGFLAGPGGGAAVASDFRVNGVPVDGADPQPPAPVLSVADAQVAEGDDGMAHLAFTVTMSEASGVPVSVHYATANGSASAANDYAAASGDLTFAPGETTKTIHVMVNGDTRVEADETLALTLSKAAGATLGTARATGTIINDDVAPPVAKPVLSVSDVAVVEGDPGSAGTAAGWFSTSGNQIVDADGQAVKIAGVNWFGFESSNAAPHGLWTRGYQDMMDQMKDLGFNTIRLPFSSEMLHATTASGIDYSQNPDLQGLTPLEIMDKIVAYAEDIGMRVILDHHRASAGAGTSENGLWYDSAHPESQWIADWQMLAERYADTPAVIGADLHNEPYAGTWGGGGATDWAAAAERAGNAIGAVNSNWLVFVEGVGSYQGESYWWGGNLMGVRDRPVALDVSNKLVYSAHDYGNSVYAQPWFQDAGFAQDLPQKFDEMWGYIYGENIAPVYVGEFGTRLEDPKDAPWLEALVSYMSGDFNNDGTGDLPAGDEGISWTYWSWNPNSGDTGGILGDDWRTVHSDKLAYLEPIQFDLGEAGGGEGSATGGSATGGAEAVFVVSLSQAATETVSVDYHTLAGTAGAADFSAESGTLTFAPGETTKLVRIPVTGDLSAEPDEQFSLVLTDAEGAVIGVAQGVATIVDDDAAAPALPTLSIADGRAEEGAAGAPGTLAFTVTLSEAAEQAVSVTYHTADGTARAGSDYVGATGTVTFAPGETTATVRVPLIGDGVAEADERFTLVLGTASGATIADGTATGVIGDDDAATPAPGGDHLAFTVSDDWNSGFVGAMTLTPEADVDGWTVAFDAPFDITNIWNAEVVSHVGDHYVVRNAAWNGTVDAAGTVSFGFEASPGGGGAVASGFTVNGAPVAQPAPAPAERAVASMMAPEPLATAGVAADGGTSLMPSTGILSDDVLTDDVLPTTWVSAGATEAETPHDAGSVIAALMLHIGAALDGIGDTDAQLLALLGEGIFAGVGEGGGPVATGDDLPPVTGAGRFDTAPFGLLI
ncbi:Calx-beta domain-containing protein [Xanthobacter sp. V4C-4]|uniref:Calx-beta domain-containing protein n=1 Tax=Xanthobacter cornucopiae TaxID=3119924 RepID=UPI003729E51A